MVEEILATRGRLQAMDCRIKPLLHEGAIEVQFHVSRPFELLENYLIHFASGIDERRGEDGQAAAFLTVARRAKEFLRLQERLCFHAAGHGAALAGLE